MTLAANRDMETMSAENSSDDRGLRDSSAGTKRTVALRLAAAVVVYDGCVLIVRRSKTELFLPNVWGVPCGKVDAGENAPEAALRELREETGLLGSVVRYLGESTFSSVWRGQAAENVQFNYLVRPLGGRPEIKLPKEDQEAAWLSRDEIDHFDGLDAYNRDVIRQWLNVDDSRQMAPAPASSMAIASSSRR